jgi:hypothetical protein
MVCTKVWSGSQALSERPVISKFGVLLSSTHHDCVLQASSRTIERPYHTTSPPYRSLVPNLMPILVSSARSYFHKRRKGGTCTMIHALRLPLAIAALLVPWSSPIAFSGFTLPLHLALPSCVSAWYKSRR